jgi:hypothetical protein
LGRQQNFQECIAFLLIKGNTVLAEKHKLTKQVMPETPAFEEGIPFTRESWREESVPAVPLGTAGDGGPLRCRGTAAWHPSAVALQ